MSWHICSPQTFRSKCKFLFPLIFHYHLLLSVRQPLTILLLQLLLIFSGSAGEESEEFWNAFSDGF